MHPHNGLSVPKCVDKSVNWVDMAREDTEDTGFFHDAIGMSKETMKMSTPNHSLFSLYTNK